MSLTFKGGVHPEYNKEMTNGKIAEVLPPPEKLYFPVSQHIGAPCAPVVAVGDKVLLGQLIASSEANVSSSVHSSVSGTVVAIETHPHPAGSDCLTIVIENDFKDEPLPDTKGIANPYTEMGADEIVEMVKKAGIAGMGGAGFPAHVKIQSALGKVDTLLINGAECEPYLSSDHRLMLEYPEYIVEGTKILKHCLGLARAAICIEDNKPDAIARIQEVIGDKNDIYVQPLKTKYPQGGEKQLIKAVTGRDIPSGKLPADVGAVVFNVDTTASVYRAYKFGLPVISRNVTVSGSGVANPKVLSVRLGTPFSHAIEKCGGYIGTPTKIVNGGPMMGVAQFTDEVPVVKTVSGILVFTSKEERDTDYPVCIRCGRCVRACPMKLAPNFLFQYGDKMMYDDCVDLGIMDCIECGACSYVCPGRMNLVSMFRVLKLKINEMRRKEQAAGNGGGGQ